MFLAESRQWVSEYDPMALVVTEFSYGGERVTTPFVVGPALINAHVKEVPLGFRLTDTKVAGIHPYTGGSLVATIVLAQIRRNSYASRLLQVVESISTVFPAGVALGPHLKVARTVLTAVEALFGMADTKPLIGERWEYNSDIQAAMEPGYFALVNAAEKTKGLADLRAEKGRLVSLSSTTPYRSADFLLFSLVRHERRSDIEELEVYKLFNTALRDAASVDEGAWPRAKAGLVSLYRELVTSPDLTWEQANELMNTLRDKVVAAHKTSAEFQLLSADTKLMELAPGQAPSRGPARDALETLGVPAGVDHDVRLGRLAEVHKLLELGN
jgi:hypothetical protein